MAIATNDELFHLTSSGHIIKAKATSAERRGAVSIQYAYGDELQASPFDLFRTMRAAEIAANNRRTD